MSQPKVTFTNPPGVHTPGSRYSHAALLEGPGRRVVVSGQIGVRPDGSVAEGEAQIAQAVANLGAILAAHGMGPANIVKMSVFLTDRALIAPWRAERERFLGTLAPTSTLLIVAGLADPRFVFEVEAEAVG
jgi:enamine deaminase RidA (YjgF/YER057c/UK114 family)